MSRFRQENKGGFRVEFPPETTKNVAVVEDNEEESVLLGELLRKYEEESSLKFNVFRFPDAVSFLTNYRGNYDIVFMDIELPDLNGMAAAKKLRELDRSVVLIFVTNMAQYAVKGYEVGALDFIVKPVAEYPFRLKLERALAHIRDNGDVKIFVPVDDGVVSLNASEIRYVEIAKHRVTYHTVRGEFNSYGTLKKVEERLAPAGFVRCNHCYLVNLRFVTEVHGFSVFLGEEELQISHPKRADFMRALADYFGRGGPGCTN